MLSFFELLTNVDGQVKNLLVSIHQSVSAIESLQKSTIAFDAKLLSFYQVYDDKVLNRLAPIPYRHRLFLVDPTRCFQ